MVPLRVSAEVDPEMRLGDLAGVLASVGARIVACSGGIDSLVLATVAHQQDPDSTVVAHTVTPAVPAEGTARVLAHGRSEGWQVELVRSSEFSDERYLSNPTNRCYWCKTNLYAAVAELRRSPLVPPEATILSGANLDDLSEYRPGLDAAAEQGVRHPFVEAGIDKTAIRQLARHLGLVEAELPSSPCLASRLYTGTRVTAARLRAVELGEAVVRSTGAQVVRCRLDGSRVRVEVPAEDRGLVTNEVLEDVATAMRSAEPGIAIVSLDERAYRPGQAVVAAG